MYTKKKKKEKHYSVYHSFVSPETFISTSGEDQSQGQIPTNQNYKLNIYKPECQYWLYLSKEIQNLTTAKWHPQTP